MAPFQHAETAGMLLETTRAALSLSLRTTWTSMTQKVIQVLLLSITSSSMDQLLLVFLPSFMFHDDVDLFSNNICILSVIFSFICHTLSGVNSYLHLCHNSATWVFLLNSEWFGFPQNLGRQTGWAVQMAKAHTRSRAGVWRGNSLWPCCGKGSCMHSAPERDSSLRFDPHFCLIV